MRVIEQVQIYEFIAQYRAAVYEKINAMFQLCNKVFVALGANLPGHRDNPSDQLLAAIRALPDAGVQVLQQSSFYRTPSFPAGSGPDYVNAVVCGATARPPAEVLAALHAIEAQAGRARAQRWGARVLDLDLLAMADTILPDIDTYRHWEALPLDAQMRHSPDRLILPHPRLHERGFVLVPFNEIAPDWRHPVRGETVAQMLAHLDQAERAEIKRLSP